MDKNIFPAVAAKTNLKSNDFYI